MIRVDEVSARIEAKVAVLTGRMATAVEFSALVERNQFPQVTPAAYVLPGVVNGGQARAATGLFIQDITDNVLVVLAIRVAGDALGAKAAEEATPIVHAVIAAVCGWGPDDAPGVFALRKAEFIGSTHGLLLFQFDFELDDQLRIAP